MKQYGLNGSYYNEEMSSIKTLDLLPRYNIIYMSYSTCNGCWVYRVLTVVLSSLRGSLLSTCNGSWSCTQCNTEQRTFPALTENCAVFVGMA